MNGYRLELLKCFPDLQETFEEDKRSPENIYRWQPRIIRAYVDAWGRSIYEAKYESSIAGFIHGYSKRIHNEGEKGRNEPYIAEGYINKSDVLWKNYVKIQNQIEIQNEIKDDPDGEEGGVKKLSLEQVAADSEFQEAILKEKFPKEVCEILSNGDNDDFKELNSVNFLCQFFNE